MSLFRPYVYKDKKGIDPNAPQKHGFFVFWEIYARKFWRFVTINLIYFAVTLPILLWVYLMANGYAGLYFSTAGELEDLLPGVSFYAAVLNYIPMGVFGVLVAISIILYGPIRMGVTYVLRNFAREEHAWISDIFSKAWENKWKGLFFGLLDVFVIGMLTINILSRIDPAESGAFVWLAVKYLSYAVLVFYLFMRHYFYMMSVTFDLSIRNILKNARLFIILGLGRNIWSFIVAVFVWLVVLTTHPVITIAALPVLAYSFSEFVVVFVCYPVIKKYMINPQINRDPNVQDLDEMLVRGVSEKEYEKREEPVKKKKDGEGPRLRP